MKVEKVRNKRFATSHVLIYCVEHLPINLSQVVTSDALRQAVSEPSVAEQLQSLLPETGEDPVTIVSSPQFQQVKRINNPFPCAVYGKTFEGETFAVRTFIRNHLW